MMMNLKKDNLRKMEQKEYYIQWDNGNPVKFELTDYYTNDKDFNSDYWNIPTVIYEEPKLKRFEYEVDYKFWSVLPYINVNFHFPEIEIGWLCFIFAWRYKV